MVIKGVGEAERRSFLSWRENGAVPCFIVEIASEGTWRTNLYEKRRLYAALGVREYFLFDPEALYLRPPLRGFRRTQDGTYGPLDADGDDRLYSEELGLFLRVEGSMLRLIDAKTGLPVLTRVERAERLEAEVARLRALLEQAGASTEPGA
jgi:Uma2 family endonuclease